MGRRSSLVNTEKNLKEKRTLDLEEKKAFWCLLFHGGHDWRVYSLLKRKRRDFAALECRRCHATKLAKIFIKNDLIYAIRYRRNLGDLKWERILKRR